MNDSGRKGTLLLVPTQLELDHVAEIACSAEFEGRFGSAQVCGFGAIASGIETARQLSRRSFDRVILFGIAGTYDIEQVPVGHARCFGSVGCYGVGAGQGDSFLVPSQLGYPQSRIGNEECFEQLDLASPRVGQPMLLSVCSAAANGNEVRQRRVKFPEALAEDMEGFSVAMAAASFGLKTTIIRGISNLAGDRDHQNWNVGQAMSSAIRLLEEMF